MIVFLIKVFKYCEELLESIENDKIPKYDKWRNNLEKTDVKSSYYFTFGNTWGGLLGEKSVEI